MRLPISEVCLQELDGNGEEEGQEAVELDENGEEEGQEAVEVDAVESTDGDVLVNGNNGDEEYGTNTEGNPPA